MPRALSLQQNKPLRLVNVFHREKERGNSAVTRHGEFMKLARYIESVLFVYKHHCTPFRPAHCQKWTQAKLNILPTVPEK